MCRSDSLDQFHRDARSDTVHPRDERFIDLKCPIRDRLSVLARFVGFPKFSNDPGDKQSPFDERWVLARIILYALGNESFLVGHLHDRGAHFLTKLATS